MANNVMIGIECPSGNRVTIDDGSYSWVHPPSTEDQKYARNYRSVSRAVCWVCSELSEDLDPQLGGVCGRCEAEGAH